MSRVSLSGAAARRRVVGLCALTMSIAAAAVSAASTVSGNARAIAFERAAYAVDNRAAGYRLIEAGYFAMRAPPGASGSARPALEWGTGVVPGGWTAAIGSASYALHRGRVTGVDLVVSPAAQGSPDVSIEVLTTRHGVYWRPYRRRACFTPWRSTSSSRTTRRAPPRPPSSASGARRPSRRRSARRLAIGDFVRGPYETALEDGELLLAVHVPEPEPDSALVHRKMSFQERPAVTVAVNVELENNQVRAARIAVGSVGVRPMRSAKAEAALASLEALAPDEDALARCADAAASECDPVADANGSVEYKRQLVRVLTTRCARQALSEASGSR